MKIVCDREKLLLAFQTAASIAPSRSPKPVLQNVKLSVDETTATLMATDLEVGIRIEVEGIDVESGGTALFPVSRFGSLLRENTDEKLAIETNAQGAIIKGDRSEFKLPSGNPEEFPEIAIFEEKAFHDVPARLFKELVRRTLFATDTESSRYALGGVLLEFESDKIIAIGTDGRRLAKMEGPANSIGGHESGEAMTIVPTRSMQLLERAIADADGEVQIAARANDVLVKTPRATISSRLVEGRFPKWRDVFPVRQEAKTIEMTVGPFFQTLRQAAIVSSDESRGIDFTFAEGNLVLSGSTADVGQTRVELPIQFSGEAITVTLDHRFVADFLKVLDTDKIIEVEIENSESATLLSTDDGYGYVVMPLARDR